MLFIAFLETEEGRERRETLLWREISIGSLMYTPQLGVEPAIQACALTGNRTHNIGVGTTLQLTKPTKPHQPGLLELLLKWGTKMEYDGCLHQVQAAKQNLL